MVFWDKWIARWSMERQLRMHLSLISGARLENQLTSGLPNWRPVVEIRVSLEPLTEVSLISYGTQSEILPNPLCWGWWCFRRFVVRHHARESGNCLFCLLMSVGCRFSNLFRTNLQTVRIFLSFHQLWALLLWGICAISRFCWCCCWNWLNYCSSLIAEGPTNSGLLQLQQGCFYCEIVADLWSAPSPVFLKKSRGSCKESLLEFLSPCEGNCESLLDLLSLSEDTPLPLSFLD